MKLSFIKAFEINGISPLPHYFEEIYSNQKGLPRLGLRGDKNYLFYSIDGHGAGYYESNEMKLSAKSVYDHFQSVSNRAKFFSGIEDCLDKVRSWREAVEKLDLEKLSDKEMARYYLTANQLHGHIFSYFVVSQPYRIKLFEEEIRSELAKRVASSRIDNYMTLLATSTKRTKVSEEEIQWLDLMIRHKKLNDKIDLKNLEDAHPLLYSDINDHFEKFKILTLGDGTWDYDISYFYNNLKSDSSKSLAQLITKYDQVRSQSKIAEETKSRLIKELYLEPHTVELIDFLAEVGHSRLMMRVDGWVPHVRTIIKLDIELSKRLGYKGLLLNFMHEQELEDMAAEWKILPASLLLDRIGKRSEFLIWHDNGKYKLILGTEARKIFNQLVPEINHNDTKELKGMTAVLGKVRGRACVYNWGDDITTKIKIIKKYPILIAGQTRPSMMPLIRQAKGIITDEGGVTSHAAIVSRELGIPSLIGTVYATKTFKDGDMVELDADNGIVRKIS